jgi:hypothetical protein
MELLLDVKGQVQPICSKSHISYWFELPEGAERLNIQFAYSPKTLDDEGKAKPLIETAIRQYISPELQTQYLEKWNTYMPLKNLLTISVDDPDQNRGAAHRHAPEQQLNISKLDASPGLVPGNLVPGQWRVTISLHAVVTECEYSLQVSKGGADDDTLGSE